MSAGLDSLGAVELRNALQEGLGLELPSTLTFDYPSVEALAAFLGSQVGRDVSDATWDAGADAEEIQLDATLASVIAGAAPAVPLVVVTSACGRGGDAERALTRDDSRTAVVAPAVDGIVRMKLSRWDSDAPAGAAVGAGVWLPRFGGLFGRVDAFDADAFVVTAAEATWIDPQQRLLLETAWECMAADAPPAVVEYGSMQGVWVGIWPPDYPSLIGQAMRFTANSASGSAMSVACGRISYVFGMQGPSVSIDTACSASLVGLHCAAGALGNGDAAAALACGVNMTLGIATTATIASASRMA
jgi:hypothetical protein